MILTATATKNMRGGGILSTLHLSEEEVTFIEESPDQPNIKYSAQCILYPENRVKNSEIKYTKNTDLLSDKETMFSFISCI